MLSRLRFWHLDQAFFRESDGTSKHKRPIARAALIDMEPKARSLARGELDCRRRSVPSPPEQTRAPDCAGHQRRAARSFSFRRALGVQQGLCLLF